jgi:hypothetical protein
MLYGNYVANGAIDLGKTIKQLGITDNPTNNHCCPSKKQPHSAN